MLSWTLFAINILFLGYIIGFLYQRSQHLPLKHFFFPALFCKLCAGILLGILYKWYFKGGDTLNYFHDAGLLSAVASENFLLYIKALSSNTFSEGLSSGLYFINQPRALLFSKILSFFSLITYHNYWLTSLYLSLLSFLGMWYLANQLTRFFPGTRYAAAVAFLFFPSVVFWSSGVMKESIAMPSLCILIAFTLSCIQTSSVSAREIMLKIPIVLLLLWLLWQLKYYYFGALVPVLITSILVKMIGRKIKIAALYAKILIWMGVFVSLLGLASWVHPNLQFENFLNALVRNHDLIYKASSPENLIQYTTLEPTWLSLLENFPKALFSGLFRPMLWEMHTRFHVFLALENSLLLVLTLLTIFQLFRSSPPDAHSLLLFATIIYILLMAMLLALASPNFGSLARYRVGFLPFFVYLLVCGANLNKSIHRAVKV